MTRQLFASDNASPAHPAILEALVAENRDHQISYGDDAATARAVAAIRELFATDCDVHFVYNGTGANVTALRAMTPAWGAVICTEMAHIAEDECGAVEAIGGFKLLPMHRADGKLDPGAVEAHLHRIGFEHTSQPSVVSLTQVTEVGTLYTPEEVAAIAAAAHAAGLSVHMDGARIANAAVAWRDRARAAGRDIDARAALRELTVDAGVDALSFGATKNGLAFGEAVVWLNRTPAPASRFLRKQSTQLHSKMRYISVQMERYLRDDLWVTLAEAANRGARRLTAGLAGLPGIDCAWPVEANGVFVTMPEAMIQPLAEEFGFYTWDEARHVVRLMVSWDTTDATIDRFCERVAQSVGEVRR